MAAGKRRAVRRNTNRPPRSARSKRNRNPLAATLAMIEEAARVCRETAVQLTEQMTTIADPLDRNDIARLRDRAEITADDLAEVRIHLKAIGKEVRAPQAEDLKRLGAALNKADSNRAARMEAAAQLLATGKRLLLREPGPTSSPEST